MTPFHYFHLGFSGGYTLYLPFSVLHDPHATTFILGLLEALRFICHFQYFMTPFHYFYLCFLEAIRFICHFQYFMTPFHYFHLGFSGGYTLYLPFSCFMTPIQLLSSRVFWRLYALFAIFSTSCPIQLL